MVRKTACAVYTEIMEAFLGIMLENRRGARVDDRGGLENRCGFRPTVGSNPTLSAERNFWEIYGMTPGPYRPRFAD